VETNSDATGDNGSLVALVDRRFVRDCSDALGGIQEGSESRFGRRFPDFPTAMTNPRPNFY
jgi:hypothetical protein